MAFSDPAATHVPITGVSPPAAWGTVVNSDIQWLAGHPTNPKPSCRLFNSTAITITTGTLTVLPFDTEITNRGGIHSTVSNTTRITCPTGGDGSWAFGANIQFAAQVNGTRIAQIIKNGATTLAISEPGAAPVAGNNTDLLLSTFAPLTAGDYIELYVFQSSGGALTLNSATQYSPVFWAYWVGL